MTKGSSRQSVEDRCDATVSRRAIVVCASVAPLLGACVSKPLRQVEADGTYCFRLTTPTRRKVCTPEPVPPAAVEADAKRFETTPAAMTVYIVRHRWADAVSRLPLLIDERATVVTVPRSLVRVRAVPGQLRLRVDWEGRSAQYQVSASAGEIVLVELVGSFWAWGGYYRWEVGHDADVRQRAIHSKLIADLDLRATASAPSSSPLA
jgi:hypothetical protein